jgi:hypothetical protein
MFDVHSHHAFAACVEEPTAAVFRFTKQCSSGTAQVAAVISTVAKARSLTQTHPTLSPDPSARRGPATHHPQIHPYRRPSTVLPQPDSGRAPPATWMVS